MSKTCDMDLPMSPAVYVQGCNMNCAYCMNWPLIPDKTSAPAIPLEKVKAFIQQQKSEYVIIGGGEVTTIDFCELLDIISLIHGEGRKVAIASNGTKPEVLSKILHLIQYVALDYKTIGDKYIKLGGYTNHAGNVEKSIKLVDDAKIGYEVRTTMYPVVVGEEDIRYIASFLSEINKDTKWFLQQFRPVRGIKIKPYTEEELEKFLDIAREKLTNTYLRYV